jgi:hydrogenase nickel incorporation protein HypA/HybF
LTIEEVPARFWCAPCGKEFVSANLYAECPDCGHPSNELRAGRELELSSMEVDHV